MLKVAVLGVALVAICGSGLQQADFQAKMWVGAFKGVMPSGGYALDEQAFAFLGLPLVSEQTMRKVTVVVFDAWDDDHGALVEAIVLRAAPSVDIVRLDWVAWLEGCPFGDFALFMECAHLRFVSMFEYLVREVNDEVVVVNMSFGLWHRKDGAWRPFLSPGACEGDITLATNTALARIAKLVMESPENFYWVASAGNTGSKENIAFPACISRVIPVAALKRAEQYEPDSLVVARYSNWSDSIALPIGGRMQIAGSWAEGTSFAAPVMSGMMATWVGICSTLPPRVDARLFATVPWGPAGARAPVPTALDVKC